MSRTTRSEARLLKQEAQGLELVASDAAIEPNRLQDYWALSLDLVALVMDIDAFAASAPDAQENDPEVIALRHRLRDISNRLADMTTE